MWREGFVSGGATRFFVRALGSPSLDLDETRPRTDDLILLLHGWPQDSSSWRLVAPRLVEAGYRVACPDLKGFGRSDAPKRGYDPETLADEISQLIRNLHARRAIVVGHDWGGSVALATAFRHPGHVRALTIASSPFRQIDLSASWHIPLLNLPILPQLAFRVAGGPLTRGALRHAAVVEDAFTDEALDAYTQAVRAAPSAWLSYYRTLSRRALVDLAIRRVRHRMSFVRPPEGPHRLRVPTTVVWGERDRATPFSLATQVARDLDATLIGIPGVGHFVHEEAPAAFAKAVLDLARWVDNSERLGREQRGTRHEVAQDRAV
jgi:epoxide hydrolase 4